MKFKNCNVRVWTTTLRQSRKNDVIEKILKVENVMVCLFMCEREKCKRYIRDRVCVCVRERVSERRGIKEEIMLVE